MRPPRPNALACSLRDFFADHLPRCRGMSPHTVRSYRDTFALLLRFVAAHHRRAAADLELAHIGPTEVIAFLQHLEDARGNTAATRNVRLAAIHAFFRYLATRDPEYLEHSQRVLAVPFKRTRTRAVAYLDYEEIAAVLAAVDRTRADGERDYALLVTMFNTGARVQEVVDLRPCDLQLLRPAHARLVGKGRKERLCPLWPETTHVLRAYLAARAIPADAATPLFRNHRGMPLTRFGVRYILAQACVRAQSSCPSLARKRLHPHTMRHSTAVHLLKAGVDLVTISHWLGHASVTTTHRYASVDLETKRAAISKAKPVGTAPAAPAVWQTDASVLTWLEAL